MITIPSRRAVAKPIGVGLLLLVGSLVTASCSGGGNSPPAAYIGSTLGQPPGGGAGCNFDTPEEPFITIGTPSSPQPTGGSFDITCNVVQSGTTFAVALFASGGSGSIEISGMIQNDPTTPQAVTGAFASMNGSYSGKCTVDFSPTQTNGAFSGNSQMGVFPTRIWGILTCPMATDQDSSNVCYGTAEFLFEYCGG